MSAAGGYTITQDAEQSVLQRAAAVRAAQPTQNEAQSGLHQAARGAQHHQGGQPWPIDYEGWEDIAVPPSSDRLVSESGGTIIWQDLAGENWRQVRLRPLGGCCSVLLQRRGSVVPDSQEHCHRRGTLRPLGHASCADGANEYGDEEVPAHAPHRRHQ